MDYAFMFSANSYASPGYSYAAASLNAAAYREGRITLDGKERHVYLVDFNSNGRFDDRTELDERIRPSDGSVYPRFGDRIYIDPDLSQQGYRSTYDVTTSDDQQLVSDLVEVDGRFYEVKLAAAGDKLSLTASSTPLGYVSNPNKGYRAVVYGDQGFLKITGNASGEAPLPAGKWKLLSYTIDRSGAEQPVEEEKTPSLFRILTDAIIGPVQPANRPRYTFVSARAKKDYEPVEVRKGETVEMPFGPPYEPVVDAQPRPGAKQVALGLTLVGVAGDVCNNMMVESQRPGKPQFTISAPDGEVVQEGQFEYG
jgi:hypothetical protein